MTTASDILARLEELWENAEPGPTREGDAIIHRYGEGLFKVEPSADGPRSSQDHIRILGRAKPKAPGREAVVASHVRSESHKREVYFRSVYGGWESETWVAEDDDLVDPVPLVEMPEREEVLAALEEGWDAWMGNGGLTRGADGYRADALLKLLRGER